MRHRAALCVDREALRNAKLRKDVKAVGVIEVEMAQEKIDRFVWIRNVLIDLAHGLARIEDHIRFLRVDQDAGGFARGRVVPAVGAEKVNVHTPIIPNLCGGGNTFIGTARAGFRSRRAGGESAA